MNDCICISDYISCYGDYITNKLSFTMAEREKVRYLDLRNTELKRVPTLDRDKWPKLEVNKILISSGNS